MNNPQPLTLATLPSSFGSTLQWPPAIETRMETTDTLDHFDAMIANLEAGVAEEDPAMLELLANLQATVANDDIDERVEELAIGRDTIPHLSQWLERVIAAGIAHVPAVKGPLLSCEDIEQTHTALQQHAPDQLPAVVVNEVLPWIAAQQNRGWMWRYEFCAPESIKQVLGTIRPPGYLDVHKIKVPFSTDLRVLHCLWDTGGQPSHLLARPWQRATFEAGFPVEFRVFRTKDGWAACNYYVQRPLPECYRATAQQAIELAQKLEIHAAGNGSFMPIEYTTDWILGPDGELKFLEAGPGFDPRGLGAHPCCFAPDNLTAGRILLQTEPGALTWCPPALQASVDRVKAGEHPVEVCRETGENIQQVLGHAAVQGAIAAQLALKMIGQGRFLAWEAAQTEANLQD